jgi:predicted nucleic acid-binding protein
MRLYLDANAIIYGVEAHPQFRAGVLHWVQQAEAAAGLLITSRLSRLECRVRPLREDNQTLLSTYEGFFARDNVILLDISSDVVDRATELRVRYRFRTPDAIHLATAILIDADVFLSGDADLARCTDIRVVTLTTGPTQ